MEEILYDTIIIELQKEGKPLTSVKIGTTDIEQLLKSHNITIGEILQDAIISLIESRKNKN